MRAVALLPAVSGNLAKPGAGFLYLNDRLEIDEDWLAAPQLGDPPEPISHMDLAARLEDPARSRSLFCWNINIAASNPEQTRLLAALGRDDLFTVVVDLFATDTGDYADLRAAGGQLPGVRRPGLVVLRSVAVGAGEGGRPGRRGAAEPGDLPPAGDGDGLHRAGAARRRPRA